MVCSGFGGLTMFLNINLSAIWDVFWIGWSFLAAVLSRPENRLLMMWTDTEITAPFLVCLCVHSVKMHPPGAPVINTTANDTWISWSAGSPLSVFIDSFDFNIQVKEEKQHWRVSAPACTFTNFISSDVALFSRIKIKRPKSHKQLFVLHNSDWTSRSLTAKTAATCPQ